MYHIWELDINLERNPRLVHQYVGSRISRYEAGKLATIITRDRRDAGLWECRYVIGDDSMTIYEPSPV